MIAAFGNSQGGKVIIGVKEPAEIVGVDPDPLKRTYDVAVRRLAPTIPTRLSFADIEGKKVGVIEVAPSRDIVLADGGTYVRTGS